MFLLMAAGKLVYHVRFEGNAWSVIGGFLLIVSVGVGFLIENSLTYPPESCKLYLLRWGVAARRFGMGSRQYGKNFPGCSSESARPSPLWRWSFLLYWKPIEMVMSNSSRPLFALFILCLGLGALFAAPVFPALRAASAEMAEVDADPVEFEEDTLLFGGYSIIVNALFVGLGAARLSVHSPFLLPAFLPPKHSCN